MSTHPWDRAFKDRMYNGSTPAPAGTWEAVQASLPVTEKKSRRGAWLLLLMLGAAVALGWVLIPQESANSAITPASGPETTVSGGTAISNSGAGAISSPELRDDRAGAVSDSGADSSTDTDTNTDTGTDANAQSESNGRTRLRKASAGEASTGVVDNTHPLGSGTSTTEAHPSEPAQSMPKWSGTSTEEETIKTRGQIGIATIGLLPAGIDNELANNVKVTDCYSFGKAKRGSWLIEAYTGPTFSIKSLASKPQENVDDYIIGRDSTESAQISWHAGLRVGYEHHSGITAKAGVHYTLVNELFKLEFRTQGTLYDTTFDNMGNIIAIDTILVDGVRTHQNQNRYHAVDIPLLIGYRIDNGDWDFGIEAGPVFNVLFKSKGYMLDAAGEPFSFSDPDADNNYYEEVFKDRVGVSIYAGLYASKRIGENLWAFVEPHMQYRLKSITLDSYPIEQKQTNIGLSFGIRLKL